MPAAVVHTVPQSVVSATFDVFGAQGGAGAAFDNPGGAGGGGGKGGEAKATLNVKSGTTYQLNVGGAGAAGD